MKPASVLMSALFLCISGACLAQPAGVTMEMINTTIPEEGAPKAVRGSFAVTSEPAFGSPGLMTFRPTNLPQQQKLPVMVWANGGCALENPRFHGFLETIASHGFLAITTRVAVAPPAGERSRQANANDLKAGIDWATQENTREGSPLRGRIDLSQVAAMGQSCGGILAISAGLDPRVRTIGVFNSGADEANPQGPPSDRPTIDSLKNLKGSVLLVDGRERDFMQLRARATFDAIGHVPVFYGSRHAGGHLMSFYHAGGGEIANVAASWLRWQLKGDREAARLFVGAQCGLCTNPLWDTAAKRLQ